MARMSLCHQSPAFAAFASARHWPALCILIAPVVSIHLLRPPLIIYYLVTAPSLCPFSLPVRDVRSKVAEKRPALQKFVHGSRLDTSFGMFLSHRSDT